MEDQKSDDQSVFDIQVAALCNDQWKWRHQHCWKILNRYGLTGLTIAIIPYLHRLDFFNQQFYPIVRNLGNWELYFPIVGWLIAQLAVCLFAEEYIRCRPLETMCNRVLERRYSSPLPVPKVRSLRTAGHIDVLRNMPRSIGQMTIFTYSSVATILTLVNIWMVSTLYELDINIPSKIFIAFIGASTLIAAVVLAIRSGNKIKRILMYQELEESRYRRLNGLRSNRAIK